MVIVSIACLVLPVSKSRVLKPTGTAIRFAKIKFHRETTRTTSAISLQAVNCWYLYKIKCFLKPEFPV